MRGYALLHRVRPLATRRGNTSSTDEERGSMATYEAYCVKCREKREFEGEEVELKNGRRAAQGKCPVCGTKVNRMLGKKS
jgi:NAD-dependent SIR2 family protein deacetylase